MKKLNLQQGSAEWLELRNNKIGASDAPVIMEVSPWTTPFQLWQIKMGLMKVEQNEAMKHGITYEPIARIKFMEEMGCHILPLVALHDDIEFMLASFDGISTCEKIVVEIKCPKGNEDHQMAMDGVIPEKYIPQLQQQMEVAGLTSMFYFSYKNDKSYKILQVEKNNDLMKEIIEKEKSFWKCMQDLEAPELIEKDYIKREDEEWKQLAQEWIEIQKMEDRKEEIRKKLIVLSGKMNSKGGGIILTRIPRKGTVDYKSIPELNGLDLERYRKPTIETYRIGVC